MAPKVLIIDNYDSFTYNLVELFRHIGTEPIVMLSHQLLEIEFHQFQLVVIGPGPGSPEDYPHLIQFVKSYQDNVPILGVCLGHQIINLAFEGTVSPYPFPVHGYTSKCVLTYEGEKQIWLSEIQPLEFMRYHSLCVQNLGKGLQSLGNLQEENNIPMIISNQNLSILGLQFHPESILSEPMGTQLILNWMRSLHILNN